MMPVELLRLCVMYLSEETCTRLARANKRCLDMLSTKSVLRFVFRAHKVGRLSHAQLQQGLHYRMYYTTTLTYTRNNILVYDRYKVINGQYMIDIFGRLWYRGSCMGKDFVNVYDIGGGGSYITLNADNVLTVNIYDSSRKGYQRQSLTNIQSFTVRSGYLLCYRRGERRVHMYFAHTLEEVELKQNDSIDVYPKDKVYPKHRPQKPICALTEKGLLYRNWCTNTSYDVSKVFFLSEIHGWGYGSCYYYTNGKYYQGYSLCEDIVHIQHVCSDPLLIKITYRDESMKIVGLHHCKILNYLRSFSIERVNYLYLSHTCSLVECTK